MIRLLRARIQREATLTVSSPKNRKIYVYSKTNKYQNDVSPYRTANKRKTTIIRAATSTNLPSSSSSYSSSLLMYGIKSNIKITNNYRLTSHYGHSPHHHHHSPSISASQRALFSSSTISIRNDDETPKTNKKSNNIQNKKQSITNIKQQTLTNNRPEIEDRYTRKTPLEHILLRPSMYVGPVGRIVDTSPTWIPDLQRLLSIHQDSNNAADKQKQQQQQSIVKMIYDESNERTVCYALHKIFDEILVNASDNRLRREETTTTTMTGMKKSRRGSGGGGATTRIDVVIDPGYDVTFDNDGRIVVPTEDDKLRDPFVSVWNDGRGIPIEIHRKEGMYVPEMLFGHLLTGSNFDDDTKRLTGGRHGYGAKLTNIFSKSFTVETSQLSSSSSSSSPRKKKERLKYTQTWTNNMSQSSPPQITYYYNEKNTNGNNNGNNDGGDYTCVSFVPDVPRLTTEPTTKIIPPDDFLIMCRRVIDIAGCTFGSLRVSLNGVSIPPMTLSDYALTFVPSSSPLPPLLSYQKLNNNTNTTPLGSTAGFEIVILPSPTLPHRHQSQSFVNAIRTKNDGTHVTPLLTQITHKIANVVAKRHPEELSSLSPAAIRGMAKNHLMIFVNALIENPTFDSQTKDRLTSPPVVVEEEYNLPSNFLNRVIKPWNDEWDLISSVIQTAKSRQRDNLERELHRLTPPSNNTRRNRLLSHIPKLEEAHFASHPTHAPKCTLILTEGDSAKALAVAGLEIVGRDYFGVFPLRGKFLNVAEASPMQLAGNEEVKQLCAILGLRFDRRYDGMKERDEGLRYGSVMLMTDQDADGSHIKGLVVNFFGYFWPELLKPPKDEEGGKGRRRRSFLSQFITPLLKVTKKGGGSSKKKESLSFYSLTEYNQWRSSQNDDMSQYKVKYYKGLGTSTPEEAKEYFSLFDRHHIPFRYDSDDTCGSRISMIFDKNRSKDRREWILKRYPPPPLPPASDDDSAGSSITYSDFFDHDMIHFSHADNIRSLPHLIDGLKPSQRKVLYACLNRPNSASSEIKVAQLAGYVAERTAYHHGEASLHATIINMAQNFVGSNNVNLLYPSGQFGTRMVGGKDAASPRYVFTKVEDVTRRLFRVEDDGLLRRREDDGVVVEPEFFVPVVPFLLLNGGQGIGTGWSTFIPSFNPHDVIAYIRAKITQTTPLPSIKPHTRGFTGTIIPKQRTTSSPSGYVTRGTITEINSTTLVISELPTGRWTNDYKAQLLKMRDRGEITSFVENHTTTSVHFKIKLKAVQLKRLKKQRKSTKTTTVDSHEKTTTKDEDENNALIKAFKLETTLPLTNMHAFDESNTIQKYDTPQDICDQFYVTRLALYNRRKFVMERRLAREVAVAGNKKRFLELVLEGTVDIGRRTMGKEEMVRLLRDEGFDSSRVLEGMDDDDDDVMRSGEEWEDQKVVIENEDDGSGDDADAAMLKDYDYLLNMPLSSFTIERIEKLNNQVAKLESELEELRHATPEDLWMTDLDELEAYL